MSLIAVANDVCDIIGIERQIAISQGTGGDARQLYSLCKRELSELARRTSWSALIESQEFTGIDQVTQTAAIPSDFMYMIPETLFNRTGDNEVFGPIASREFQLLATTLVPNATGEVFRIVRNDILILPNPTVGDSYAFEYVTSNLATAADLTTNKATYLIDTDVAKLDEELIKLGVVWRWKALKGLDYAEDMRTYENQVANSIARDGGKRTISMDPGRPPGIPVIGIPSGNWTP